MILFRSLLAIFKSVVVHFRSAEKKIGSSLKANHYDNLSLSKSMIVRAQYQVQLHDETFYIKLA